MLKYDGNIPTVRVLVTDEASPNVPLPNIKH